MVVGIIIDIIIIAFILLSTFLGYKRGLIGAIFKILSFLIAIIITILLYKPVSNLIIEKTTLDDVIYQTIYDKISSEKLEQPEESQQESDLPEVVQNYITDGIQGAVDEARDSVSAVIAQNLTGSIINFISILAIFIITRIILLLAKAIFEAVGEIPVIKQLNEVGGIAYGLLRGIFLIYVVLAILSFLLPLMDQTLILGYINESVLTKFFYQNNVILNFFMK